MAHRSVEPSPAGTVLLLRPSPLSFEVLMVHRRQRGFFGGLAVFPGGGVDEIDHSRLASEVVTSGSRDRAYRAAAMREVGEETGILLESRRAGTAPDERGPRFYRTLRDRGTTLDGDGLVLVSRWVTPEIAPRRFDTWFYVFALEEMPEVRLDRAELTGYEWVAPVEALRRYEAGEWAMVSPTVAHLRWLARRSSMEDALKAASGADGRTLVEPRQMEDGSLVPLIIPGEPA